MRTFLEILYVIAFIVTIMLFWSAYENGLSWHVLIGPFAIALLMFVQTRFPAQFPDKHKGTERALPLHKTINWQIAIAAACGYLGFQIYNHGWPF